MNNLVFLAKCDQGIIKVYDHGNDFQCIIVGDEKVSFPEVWSTHHKTVSSNESLLWAIDKIISRNKLTNIGLIKKVIYAT